MENRGGERLSSYRRQLILGLRGLQVICIGATITGAVWGSSDILLTTVLVKVPITPLSVLLMLYGTMGTSLIEITIRWLSGKEYPKK